MKFKTILVPLDGSKLAEIALPQAIEFARGGARVVLLRAVEGEEPGEPERYLATVQSRLRATGVAEVAALAWRGLPAAAIGDAARFCGADLIVMSSHGRSGLDRFLFGSVAETLLRSTPAPIFLVRPGAHTGDDEVRFYQPQGQTAAAAAREAFQ